MSFQKFSGGFPRILTAGGGDPLSHPTPARPLIGPKTLVPLNFSAMVASLSVAASQHRRRILRG